MPLLTKTACFEYRISPLTWTRISGMQAKEVAAESAAAEARAAAAALRAVEAGIALYAEKRDYLKLKDIAEASDVAGKVRAIARSFSCVNCRPRITAHSDPGIRYFLIPYTLRERPPSWHLVKPAAPLRRVSTGSDGPILNALCLQHRVLWKHRGVLLLCSLSLSWCYAVLEALQAVVPLCM
jgi:hypothetical protein